MKAFVMKRIGEARVMDMPQGPRSEGPGARMGPGKGGGMGQGPGAGAPGGDAAKIP
jgi:hypothetical protein